MTLRNCAIGYYIAEYEQGIPDVANLIAISDKFGLSLDELIKGNVDVKTENFY